MRPQSRSVELAELDHGGDAKGPHPHLARMFTVEEAASLTSLGRTTLYAEIAAGRLRSCAVGRARRIRAADLEAWVAQLSDARPV